MGWGKRRTVKHAKRIVEATLSERAMREQELAVTFRCWSCSRAEGGLLVPAKARRGVDVLDVLVCPLCLLGKGEKQRERRRR